MSRISKLGNIASQQVKLVRVLEEKVISPSVPKPEGKFDGRV